MGKAADQWLTNVRWDPDLDYGVSGQYGGTTAEFTADYTQFTGGIPPAFLDAVSITTKTNIFLNEYKNTKKTFTINI